MSKSRVPRMKNPPPPPPKKKLLNLEDEEQRTVVSSFIEHCKNEHDLIIPDECFESYFNA